jgi:L-2-hydroxyglutarate oxidase LhgO
MDATITIIGAGVVGLAIAENLSSDFNNIFVLEKHTGFGQETSSRNSEVIHAGIYYPKGSLKARLCVEGKEILYEYCRKYDIGHRKCGKLIVATTPQEVPIIQNIKHNAEKNGVNDLILLEKDQIKSLEPNIFAIKAVFSPSTGIVDSHELMKRLEINAINNGVQIAYGNKVTGIRKLAKGYKITVVGPDSQTFDFTTEILINSAGLSSDLVSGMVGIRDNNLKINFCKGEYFKLNPPKNRLIDRLIYPVPYKKLEGIGIHVTVDMGGGVKLGPDVTWLSSNIYDYKVTSSKQAEFFRSVSRFLPFLDFNDLSPDMAGIRPKIQRPGEEIRDFYIREEANYGFPGFINLVGIESPGLTSSLSIAKYVRNLISI